MWFVQMKNMIVISLVWFMQMVAMINISSYVVRANGLHSNAE